LLPATRRALLRRVAVGQAEGRAPSVVGAVVRDGVRVWCGSRSMIAGHEPDGNIQYRIGSLTKMFVAVLIMRLREEGLVDLCGLWYWGPRATVLRVLSADTLKPGLRSKSYLLFTGLV
jgi:hypothetical protein